MHRPSSAALALVAVALLTTSAVAQGVGAPRGGAATAPNPAPRLAVATNPLAIPFGMFTLDVESATGTPGLTLGVGGTWLTDGRDQGWADARLMYFPNEAPFRGFAIGLTAGMVAEEGDRANELGCAPFGGPCTRRPGEAAATLGVRMDYDWLVGARKRMLVGVGLGAKRTLRDVDSRATVLDQVYGDGRLVVGFTF
jgi:hypothetical protein